MHIYKINICNIFKRLKIHNVFSFEIAILFAFYCCIIDCFFFLFYVIFHFKRHVKYFFFFIDAISLSNHCTIERIDYKSIIRTSNTNKYTFSIFFCEKKFIYKSSFLEIWYNENEMIKNIRDYIDNIYINQC